MSTPARIVKRELEGNAPTRDTADFTERYNTDLSPDEEIQFEDWRAKLPENLKGTSDYDLRGAWKSGAQEATNGHLPDTFKKPNHITFSDESQYHGVDNNAGGKWEKAPTGKWSFTPGDTNLKMHGEQGLSDYFKRAEPDSTLNLPQKKGAPAGASIVNRVQEPQDEDPEAKPFVDRFKQTVSDTWNNLPRPDTIGAVKQLGAGTFQAVLGLGKSALETPHVIARAMNAGYNEVKAGGVPDALNMYAFPSMVFDYIDNGFKVGETKFGGFSDAADSVQNAMDILPAVSPTFKTLGSKGEEVDAAASALLKGNPDLLKKVATDPEAWGAFIGQGLPSLYTAWKSGGSIPFMAWLEAMGAADDATQYEKQTGQKMSDEQFLTSTAIVGATNAFLEKFGLESILGKTTKKLAKSGASSLIGRFVEATVGEGGTEALQQIVQNSAAMIYDPALQDQADAAIHEGKWEPFLESMSKQVIPSAMGGAGLGIGGAGLHMTLTKTADALDQYKQRNSEERVLTGDATAEQAAVHGVEKVPVTFDLLDRVSKGEDLTPHEMYTVTNEGLGSLWGNRGDERIVLNQEGIQKRQELEPQAPQPERITMEGSEYTIEPATIEHVEPDLTPRALFTKSTEGETKSESRARMERAANFAQTSERNELPQPTQAQQEAGNYRKGHVRIQGIELSIENPKGSLRTGPTWQRKMMDTYGYIRGTVGKDKDHVDAFVGPNPYSQQVFVVNQHVNDKFDEHKVMLGYDSQPEAEAAYQRNYPKGWKGMRSVAPMSMPQFKLWLKNGDHQDQAPLPSVAEKGGVTFETGKPVTFGYHEKVSTGPTDIERKAEMLRAVTPDARVLQFFQPKPSQQEEIQPEGTYVTYSAAPRLAPAGSRGGTATFENPLVIPVNSYGSFVNDVYDEHSWKVDLSMRNGGKQGAELTQALREQGHDGIVVANMDETGKLTTVREIVALNGLHAEPMPERRRAPKTNEGAGIGRDRVLAVASRMFDSFSHVPGLQVVQAFEDLPRHLQELYEGDKSVVTGIYDQGAIQDDVYLIANNISSHQEAAETMLHEYVGHYGLRSVIGADYEPFMDQVYASFPELVREAARVQGLDWTDIGQRRVAAEEFIAYSAQRMFDKKSLPQRMQEILRDIVQYLKNALTKLTGGPVKITDRQLWQVLARAHDYVVNPGGYVRDERRGARRSVQNPTYFSQMFKQLNDDPAKSMSPADWLRVVQAHVKNGRLKPEEVQWSGIEEWLKDLTNNELVYILKNSMQTSLIPKEIFDAFTAHADATRNEETAREARASFLRNYRNPALGQRIMDIESAQKDQKFPVLTKALEDASAELGVAAAAWDKFADRPPLKIPKEAVLAFVQANGVRIEIQNKVVNESEAPEFDERYPDETTAVDDDGDEVSGEKSRGRVEEAKYEAYDEHLQDFWDENSSEYQELLAEAYENNSTVSRYKDDGEKLDSAEYIEKVEEEEGSGVTNRAKDEANEQYREALDSEHYQEFSEKWDKDHTKERWTVGEYDITRVGEGQFEVHQYERGDYIGSYSDASDANQAIKEDFLETAEGAARWSEYTLPGSTDYEEWLFKWDNPQKAVFTHGHWEGQQNFVAHARFDVRNDKNDKPAIFIDELQSDWHQQIRDHGLKDPRVAARARGTIEGIMEEYREKTLGQLARTVAEWQPTREGLMSLKAQLHGGDDPSTYAYDAGNMIDVAIEKIDPKSSYIDEQYERLRSSHYTRAELQRSVYLEHGGEADLPGNHAEASTPPAQDGTTYAQILDLVDVAARKNAEKMWQENDRKVAPVSWNAIVGSWEQSDRDTTHSAARNPEYSKLMLPRLYFALANHIRPVSLYGFAKSNEEQPAVDQRRADLRQTLLTIAEQMGLYESSSKGIEAAPFAKTWQLLVIKGLIREAVNRGHQRLFMAPGEVAGVRWNGGVSVDAIEWERAMVPSEIHADKLIPGVHVWTLIKTGEHEANDEKARAESNMEPKYSSYARASIEPLHTASMQKLHSVLGADAARVIHQQIENHNRVQKSNQLSESQVSDTLASGKPVHPQAGRVYSAQDLGRSYIWMARNDTDTLSGAREIYNVITPNMVNKFLKKYGAKMKLGVVKDAAPEEEHGVRTITTNRRRRAGEHSPFVVRQVAPSEYDQIQNGRMSTGEAGQPLWGVFQADEHGVLQPVRDSVSTQPGQAIAAANARNEAETKHEGFEAWEIEITPELAEAAKGGFPLFSKKGYGDPQLDAAMKKAATEIFPPQPSTAQRVQQKAQQVMNIANKWAKLQQAFTDQFAGIKYAIRSVYGEDLPAETSGYKQAHFTTSIDGQLHALLTHGMFEWRDGITQLKAKSKGLLEVLEPVADHIHEWGYWMAAVRANRLMKEGRENLFDQETIDGLLKLSNYHPEFKDVAVEYAKWKAELLDWAQAAGVIDPVTRGLWENADHVPFYRVRADELGGSFGRNAGVAGTGGIANQMNPIRRLKGGKEPLGDILENIILNMTNLISTSMKNRAAALTIDNLKDSGLVEPAKGNEFLQKALIDMGDLQRKLKKAGVDPRAMPDDALNAMRQMWTVHPPSGDDIISILVDGKKKYYHIKDETLFRALTAINQVRFNSTLGKALMAPFRTSKSLLAHTITLAGGYMAANWLRDGPSQWVNSRYGKAPRFDRSVLALKKALFEEPEMQSIMAAGGSFYSGYVNALNATATTKAMKRDLRSKGFKDSIIDSPFKLFDLYQKLGVAAENSNRIAMNYIPTKEAGKSTAEAVWEAKDALNFAKHGDNAIIQFLAQSVFTFNARIQGLARTGQQFKRAPGATSVKALLYTIASLALYLAFKDDDRYKELAEDDKDLYHHWWWGKDHYRLPKAFELGTIFGTLPERMTEFFTSNASDRTNLAIDRTKFIFNQVFQLWDPVTVVPAPNLIQPEIERRFNYDFFRRGRIIPDYMAESAKAAPELTYNEQTSPTVRELVKYMPNFFGPDFRNPLMLQHEIEGYTGTVGSTVLMLSDDLVRKAFDYPPRPALAWSQWPVAGRFYRDDEPPRRSKYEEVIYSVREAARGIDAAVKEMSDRDFPNETIDAFLNAPSIYGAQFTNQEISDAGKAMKSSFKQLSGIYKEMDEIWLDPNMDPQQKLLKLNQLYREKANESREAFHERPGAAPEELMPVPQQLLDNIKGLAPDDAADKLRVAGRPATADLLAALPRLTSPTLTKVLRDA